MAPPTTPPTRRTYLYLHMGVVVIPYANEDHARGIRSVTTWDVARWLEGSRDRPRYQVMNTYYRVHQREILQRIHQGAVRGLRQEIMGGPRIDPYARAMTQTMAGFRQFISSQEAERVGIPGTPTMAALLGISHRYANPLRRRSNEVIRRVGRRRPSFRDVGLYQRSYRSWLSRSSAM